jgi:hypothetical protein
VPEEGQLAEPALPAFAQVIPVQPGAERIVVLEGTSEIGSLALTGTAPAVAFDFQPGAAVQGNQVVSWTVTDPDSAQHFSHVEYSSDGGGAWRTIALNLPDNSLEVDFDTLGGSATGSLLRVQVSDGVNTGEATVGPFQVPAQGPEAVILQPEDNAAATVGQPVVLQAAAHDPEDGTLEGNAITWSSSRDGDLGTGSTLVLLDLSVGTHNITLSATDSDNQTATDTVIVRVAGGDGTVGLSGDVDCAGGVNSIDALKLLRHVAGLDVAQTDPCPDIGTADGELFGDINCDGSITAVDALFVLRFVAALPANVPQGCRPVGT